MMRNCIKLITTVTSIAILLVSCRGAGKVIPEIERDLGNVHPKPIPHVPDSSEAAQSLEALFKESGERARQAKEAAKATAEQRVSFNGNMQAYKENLRQEAYKAALEELQNRAIKATEKKLREMAEQIATEIVTEVVAANFPNQNSEANENQSTLQPMQSKFTCQCAQDSTNNPNAKGLGDPFASEINRQGEPCNTDSRFSGALYCKAMP